MVDEEDTVADVREHSLGPLALLSRDPAPRDRRRHGIGHGQQRHDDGEPETDHTPARQARLRVDVGAGLQRSEPGPVGTGTETLGDGPVAGAAGADVTGASAGRPRLDPQGPFRAHEPAVPGKAELPVTPEIGAPGQPPDELMVEREENGHLADRASLGGEEIDPPDGRGRRNRAAPGPHPAVRVPFVHPHPPDDRAVTAVEELVLHASVAREPGGGQIDLRQHPTTVEAAGGVQAVDEPGVGVVSLALRRIAAEPPRRDGERDREQQECDREEPDPAGPGAHSPPRRRGSAGEGCVRLHPGRRPRRPQRRDDPAWPNGSAEYGC